MSEANRHEKSNAVGKIRDYYNPTPFEAMQQNTSAPFERAKAEYISAITRNLAVASSVELSDLFKVNT